MNKDLIIQETADYAKRELSGESTGHDWWHVYRVWKLAKHIAEIENADSFVVELAVLLHDIADYKFNDGDHDIGVKVSRDWLESQKVEEEFIIRILECVRCCSFSSGHSPSTKEAEIVQDSDRLDAIGAIGIARAFATGAYFKSIFFDPDLPKENQKTTIGHFYEKLLLLKDKMHTEAGKQIAQERHEYLEYYLKRFYSEWKGER
jgi:uncharacterized protein